MPLTQLRLVPGGLLAEFKRSSKSYNKLICVYISGPAGNLLVAVLFSGSRGFGGYIFEANLAIGLFNLIPIHPLDGGQILLIVLYKRLGISHTLALMKKLAIIFKIVFCLLGTLQLIWFKNPSLLVAALILPRKKLLEERMSMMRLENFLNRRQRIIKRKLYPVRHLVAMEDCNLGEIIRRLDYDRFHIIYVLNDAMEIIGRISEHQILKALQTHSSGEAIRDIMQ